MDNNHDRLEHDLNVLIILGLIEVTGITESGDWIYGVTNAALQMTPKQVIQLVSNYMESEQEDQNDHR